MNLDQILTDLEQGNISTERAKELLSEQNKLKKIIERLKNQYEKPPYEDMLNSSIGTTRIAAENATLGWRGAMSLAILIVDLAI